MNILPQPKRIKTTGGTLSLAGLTITLTQNCDSRIFKAAQKLRDEIFGETGIEPEITKVLGFPQAAGKIVIDCGGKKSEGYKLTVCGECGGIKIAGDSLAGAFYGIQTLRQMLAGEGEDIPCCEIEDKPDMNYRGFYHDASRGRVPTVEGCKQMIDFLSYFKHNSYQIYIEHTFAFDEYKGIYKAFGYLTPEEILEIDEYCWENFIDFVPSLSTFGHLFRPLESDKLKHLCELEEYGQYNNPWVNTMLHHTINASDPKSAELICSLIDKYVPLFRSKYFNICCDETYDICQGKSAGRDKGELYLEFTLKIIDHLRSLGKTVMMWGDIVLRHPETMSRFPDDMIMLNWAYSSNPNIESISVFAQQRFGQIVCPGTSCWNQFVENVGYAEQNITKMVGEGGRLKVMGMLNTSWGDYGSVCPMTCTLYGAALGGALAWNHRTKAMCEKYDKTASLLIYGDASGETVKLIRELGKCEDVLSWGPFVNAVFDNRFWYVQNPAPLPKDSTPYRDNAKHCFEIAEKFRRLDVQSEYTDDLRIAAEGLGLMNEQFAHFIDKQPQPEDGRVEKWCERYIESWLKYDKLSEVNAVCDVMRGKRFRTKDLLAH